MDFTTLIQLAIVTRPQRRHLWRVEERRFMDQMERHTRDLYTGRVNLREWHDTFKDEVKRLHITSAVIGRPGGWDEMTQSDWGRVGRILRDEYQFVRGFSRDIFDRAMDGDLPSIDYTLNRLRLYAQKGGGTGRNFETRYSGNPDDLMIWVRNLDDSCATCIGRESMVVRRGDITFWPRDGSTECLTNCGCEWELYQSAEQSEGGNE
jgi:hypothetical protein